MKRFKIKLNEGVTDVENIDGYAAFAGKVCLYSRGQAIQKLRFIDGKKEEVEIPSFIKELKVTCTGEASDIASNLQHLVYRLQTGDMDSFELDNMKAVVQLQDTKKFTVQNVLHVIDIWHEEVSSETQEFLKEYHCSYTDNQRDLSEDLLNVPGAWDENRYNEDLSTEVRQELEALSDLCADHDAGYVRFIKF